MTENVYVNGFATMNEKRKFTLINFLAILNNDI